MENPDEKFIALTFDDGPNNIATPLVLDRCEKYNIPATFFVNGKNISDETADVMKRALSLGCEFQNHSQNHLDMKTLDKNEIEEEIRKTDELVKKYTGKAPKFFRPPFINVNQMMYDTIEHTFICGNGSKDWSADESPEETVRIILSKVQNGDVILLHDSYYNSKSAYALDQLIPALLMQDYEFVTVSKLFEIFGVEPKRNIIYSNVIDN